jgi:hypothetical protein
MLEIILTIAIAIGGAIIEHESNGAVTQIIMYSDNNLTVKCKQ